MHYEDFGFISYYWDYLFIGIRRLNLLWVTIPKYFHFSVYDIETLIRRPVSFYNETAQQELCSFTGKNTYASSKEGRRAELSLSFWDLIIPVF